MTRRHFDHGDWDHEHPDRSVRTSCPSGGHRHSAFGSPRFFEIEQSDGNSVAWVSARHLASGQQIRFASVHLDGDSQVNRENDSTSHRGQIGFR
jgi:hypothetical protein